MENIKEQPKYMERVNRLKAKVFDTYPEIDLEDAKLLTESFLETQGENIVTRKAKAFLKQCREKNVTIWDDELIVGNAGSKIRGGILSADVCWSVLDKELETINTREYDKFHLRAEDKKMFEELVRPYWKGRSNYEEWLVRIPADVAALRDNGALYIDKKAVRGWGEVTAGYSWFINNGVEGLVQKINARKAQLDATVPGDYEKEIYLDSLLYVAEGMVTLAERYAIEAERLASLEKDGKRKKELERIAQTCRRVPAKPARTFVEAMQSFYFYQICIFMEQNAAAYNPGRMDQYFYPFYKSDLEEGRITPEEAQELFDCLWVKFSEQCLFQDAKSAEYASGY
ncbi:MAG: pyruvate formate lyase family protein, partial [Synergistaceae bacterium]